MREPDRGVQGERWYGKILFADGQPLPFGVSGARECESREGDEQEESDVDDEVRQTRRFLMEKHCSA